MKCRPTWLSSESFLRRGSIRLITWVFGTRIKSTHLCRLENLLQRCGGLHLDRARCEIIAQCMSTLFYGATERMLTLAFVVNGKVNLWFNIFGFRHCRLSDSWGSGVGCCWMLERNRNQCGSYASVTVVTRACHSGKRGLEEAVARDLKYGTARDNYSVDTLGLFRIHLP